MTVPENEIKEEKPVVNCTVTPYVPRDPERLGIGSASPSGHDESLQARGSYKLQVTSSSIVSK
jgi:hypothetical protein